MSELFQSGQYRGASDHHPDADQLSAFMEEALPAHEREQVLAHLAVCPDCRETVALSLPHLEAPPVAEPARKRWFSGWAVFVPAAAVLAGSVLIAVYVHHANTGGAIMTASQVAASQPSAPVLSPAQTASLSTAPEAAESKAARGLSTAPEPRDAVSGVVEQRRIAALAPLPQAVPVAPPPTANQITQPAAGLSAGAASASPQVTSNNAPLSSTDAVVVEREEPAVSNASTSLKMSLQPLPARPVVFRHPLPSGLEALSVATDGPAILAIDAHNAVYISNDSGEHWTGVQSPWRGRAVHVNLVSHAQGNAPVAGALLGGRVANFANSARLLPAMNARLTGEITDASGAVIPGATVTIRNATTSAERTLTTDATGRYLADDLEPGNYSVEARATGFMAQRADSVPVETSKQTAENLTLQVRSVSEAVTVEASSEPVYDAKKAKSKALKSPAPIVQPQARFEIMTDTGEHWTSADGIAWQRR
jgi:hypothetical protein